ncbi:hypothetical protein ABC955_10015 [Citromicrobium bathyomarinum]
MIATATVEANTPENPDKVEGWHDLFARYVESKREADTFHAEVIDPLHRDEMKRFPVWPARGQPEHELAREWRTDSGFEAASERFESLVEAYAALADELLKRPAPDAKAALWKFDYLFSDFNEDGYLSGGWARSFCSQALSDIRRFLGAA